MAFRKCPQCDARINSYVQKCRSCGYSFKKQSDPTKIFVFIGVGAVLVILIAVLISLTGRRKVRRLSDEEWEARDKADWEQFKSETEAEFIQKAKRAVPGRTDM